jgi:hypothetical protein
MHEQWVENQKDGSARALTLEERLELDAIGYRSWHDWSVDHWGTKWNADYCSETVTIKQCRDKGSETTVDAELFYCFDTAWAPPMPIFEALAKLHSRLTFVINYEEVGMDFGGDLVFKNGGRTYYCEYYPSMYCEKVEDEDDDQ